MEQPELVMKFVPNSAGGTSESRKTYRVEQSHYVFMCP